MAEQTNIAKQIARIQTDRDTIRTKLVELGMASAVDNLDKLATAVGGIVNNGAVSATVQEGDTYTIPKGYHNGSGTVSGVAGGGNYNLQSKQVTPTKSQQNITPDSGYYGLSDVTVSPIPNNFQDVSSSTATEADVLSGKTFVKATGELVAGTMSNNGTVTKKLDTTTKSYTIPSGYHSGLGSVSITTESKSTTPNKTQQTITPTSGSVLESVVVEAIPENYIDTSLATATEEQILDGASAYVDGELVTGTMTNNGSITTTLSATQTTQNIAKGYHNGTGSVSITLEEKVVTPTKLSQEVVPASGKVLSKVTVGAIPADYITTTDATATANQLLTGATAYVAGTKITGTMANNGAVNNTIDGMTVTSVSILAGYTSGGTISLTPDIEDALSAI